MASYSISQNPIDLNEEIISREHLDSCLLKADALMGVALEDNFLSRPKVIIHHYLWAINDLMELARSQNCKHLQALYKSYHK